MQLLAILPTLPLTYLLELYRDDGWGDDLARVRDGQCRFSPLTVQTRINYPQRPLLSVTTAGFVYMLSIILTKQKPSLPRRSGAQQNFGDFLQLLRIEINRVWLEVSHSFWVFAPANYYGSLGVGFRRVRILFWGDRLQIKTNRGVT